MPPTLSREQVPQGGKNALHDAASSGSVKHTETLLSSGKIDVDQADAWGWTPLMLTAEKGHARVARILLTKGASWSSVDDEGHNALQISARNGHADIAAMLVEAGADPDETSDSGFTPLHEAACGGHALVMRVLIEAGANVNCRARSGQTPLHITALEGDLDAMRELLRAKASPLLRMTLSSGTTCIPLDGAALNGNMVVARELIRRFGISGCGGASAGVDALINAAHEGHLDMMAMLIEAGVVDTGTALTMAAGSGWQAPLKLLLEQNGGQASGSNYAKNSRDPLGQTPLICAVCRGLCPPRTVRLLVDAGVDTASAGPAFNARTRCFNINTPLGLAARCLEDKEVGGDDATEEQLRNIEGIRRLLLQVEAVHAVSWLWRSDVGGGTVGGDTKRIKTKNANGTPGTPPTSISSIMWRRPKKRGVFVPAVSRYSKKAFDGDTSLGERSALAEFVAVGRRGV